MACTFSSYPLGSMIIRKALTKTFWNSISLSHHLGFLIALSSDIFALWLFPIILSPLFSLIPPKMQGFKS